MTVLRRAAVVALGDLLRARPDLAILGVEPALAALLGASGDPRLLPMEAQGARAALGAGLALGGRAVVTLAHGDEVADGPLPKGGQVLLTTAPEPAARWWACGATVVQPAIAEDVAPLLAAALDLGEPVVFRLDDPDPADLPASMDSPQIGVPRWLARGPAGVVVGAGRSAGALAACLRLLGKRSVHAAAADMHTLAPGGAVCPTVLDRALLVGGARAAERVAKGSLAGLLPVPLGADHEATAAAVLAMLPVGGRSR